MKKGFAIGLGIFLSIGLLFGALIFMFIRNYVNAFKWDVHETMTMEEKEDFSYRALYPGLADCLERSADKGMRDAEYLIETYKYNSVEEMCEAVPGCTEAVTYTLENITPEQSEDMKGVSVKRYAVAGFLPLLDKDSAPDKYKVYTYNAFHDYFIYEYEDGTYRFASTISTC